MCKSWEATCTDRREGVRHQWRVNRLETNGDVGSGCGLKLWTLDLDGFGSLVIPLLYD